jgi:hypothetical protein
MSFKLRSTRITSLAVSAGIALTALAVTGAPASAASQTCTPPKYPGSGYFTGKIRVTNISCSYGKRFVVAYYKCRTKSGSKLAGRCTTKVLGFSCTEKRESIATEIDARVTCRRGTQRIVHTYQQNIE